MSLLCLPLELLDSIFLHLLPADLPALCRTHPIVCHAAQRLLYRHISVDFLSRNFSVVVTLANKPELARHVRTFAVRLYPSSSLFLAYYRRLRTALSSMSELTSLEVFADPSTSWVLRTESGSTYPHLVRLACSFPLDSHVVSFLEKADGLLELELDHLSPSGPHSNISMHSATIPRLSEFVGSSQTAQIVVPGRPVQSIHLSFGELTENMLENLAKSTASVLVLGGTTSSLPVPLLGRIAYHMQHLVYLRIMTTYNFATVPDAAFYENVADVLASLPDLKAFELCGMHWGSSQKSLNDSRVWQSEPLNSDLNADNAPVDLEADSDYYFTH